MDIAEIRKKAKELREKAEAAAKKQGGVVSGQESSGVGAVPGAVVDAGGGVKSGVEAGGAVEGGVEAGRVSEQGADIEAGQGAAGQVSEQGADTEVGQEAAGQVSEQGVDTEVGQGAVQEAEQGADIEIGHDMEIVSKPGVVDAPIEPSQAVEPSPPSSSPSLGAMLDVSAHVPEGDGDGEGSARQEEAEAVTDPHLEAVTFMLDNEEYAIDICQIKEVIKSRVLTDIPRAPEDIVGVLSLRGFTVPIMNLRKRIGLPEKSTGKLIIIVRDGDEVLGFLVDSVKRVVRVLESSLEPPPSIKTPGGELIKAIGRDNDESFILLHMDKVLEEL